ncbi:MAG: DUF5309 domain-containing protein [Candidatus Thiodiazotropha weberae]|nr:DUF5309 domain-containing protein [Candidatus Thiodiazotropha weberae]
MAQAVGATSSYDVSVNREDLGNVIHMIDPTETPIISAMGTNNASNTKHEWIVRSIRASAANAHIEGDDAAPSTRSQASRLDNQCQILKEHAVVTGTQQKGMDHAGVKDKMAEEMSLAMAEVKLDLERAVAGVHNAKVVGNDTTAREMGSIQSYLTTNSDRGATATEPTGDGSDVPGSGTARDFTETILESVLEDCYTNGAKPKIMYVSATNKGVVADFTGGGTHYVDKDNKELINSVDVYIGSLGHTLKVVPSRELNSEDVLLIDPEYIKLSNLRNVHSYDLAKQGDSFRKEIVWETTLEVCNEAAHAIIGDTNG